jgi:copper chaperone CopZ
MKTRIIITFSVILLLAKSFAADAQIKSASLQAAGLTCAMCTKAIDKALSKVPFVKEVKPDIKSSSFLVTFKEGQTLDFDALGKAVEDAGFSVARLQLKGQFDNIKVENDKEVRISGNIFHFTHVNDQTLNGEKTIMLIDKNFLSAKDFKKFNIPDKASAQNSKAITGDASKQPGRIYTATI